MPKSQQGRAHTGLHGRDIARDVDGPVLVPRVVKAAGCREGDRPGRKPFDRAGVAEPREFSEERVGRAEDRVEGQGGGGA